MPFQNIKPLHILWQKDLPGGMLSGVLYGVMRVLSLAGVSKEINLEYLGRRREPNWITPNLWFNPHQSLDWYIWWASINSKKVGHLNSVLLLDSLADNPTHKTEPRYELVVVNEPLHWCDPSARTVIGIGRQGQGSVITLDHHQHLRQPRIGESDKNRKKKQSYFFLATQMLTMHELGHVFGLFPWTGGEDPTDQELKEAHCQNECVMVWQENYRLYKKIAEHPFCPSCLEKLKQFFIKT